eukprot:gene34402-41637_t
MEGAAWRSRQYSRQVAEERELEILDREATSRTRKRRAAFDDFNYLFSSFNGSIEEAAVESTTRPRRRRFEWTADDNEMPVDKRVRITLPEDVLDMDMSLASLYEEEETKDDIPAFLGRRVESNEGIFGYLFFINRPEDEQKHDNNRTWLEGSEKHVEVPIA